MTQSSVTESKPSGNITPFFDWLKELNKTRSTGHRWRQELPWLNDGIINISGRLYIRRETIAEFERRAAAGEFRRNIAPETGE
jgi:hypothetical protein